MTFSAEIAAKLHQNRDNESFMDSLSKKCRELFKRIPEQDGRNILDSSIVDPFSVLAYMFTYPFGKSITHQTIRFRVSRLRLLELFDMGEQDFPDVAEWAKSARVSKDQRKFFNHRAPDGQVMPAGDWWDLLACAVDLASGSTAMVKRFAELYDNCKGKVGFPACLSWVAPDFFLSLENARMRNKFSDGCSVKDMSANQYLDVCKKWQEIAVTKHTSLAELQAAERA